MLTQAILAATTLALAGPLTPPAGAPSPTHKTLTEVEPRIVVNATNTPGTASSTYEITASGSYYLEENLVGEVNKTGININNTMIDVTLDLNGFTISGHPSTTTFPAGVRVNAPNSSVVIRDGHTVDWKGYGILVLEAELGSIENISARNNDEWGIFAAGLSNTVSVDVISCSVSDNGGIAQTGGIYGGSGSVRHCRAYRNTGTSIAVNEYGTVEGNKVDTTFGTLFQTGIGIQTLGANIKILNNTVSRCEIGIHSKFSGSVNNIFLQNIVDTSSFRAFDIGSGNFGNFISATPNPSPVQGSTGGAVVTTDPLANIALP